jgi:hypothetical protein
MAVTVRPTQSSLSAVNGADRGRLDEPVWAITSYFDPTGRKRRLKNYREFRRRLQVPLVAVELSFDGSFDLTTDDAEILIQVRGGSILWQKERLLNLALQALPSSCNTVAWLDCDTILTRPDWPNELRRMLDRCVVVQLFERMYHLPPDFHLPPDYKGDSTDLSGAEPFQGVACFLAQGNLPAETFRIAGLSQRYKYNPGMAWGAKRSTLEAIGFYDAAILGTGDKALFSAACGYAADYATGRYLGPLARMHYLKWAERFYQDAQKQIGYIEGDLFHLWHGDLVNRRYSNRHALFSKFEFDPYTDIALNEEGVWRWCSEKPEMHEYVRAHFETAESMVIAGKEANAAAQFLSA